MSQSGEFIAFGDYTRILKGSWFGILAFLTAGLLAGIVATRITQPVYKADAEIVFESTQSLNPMASDMSPFSVYDGTFIHTQMRVLQSDYLVERAVSLLCQDTPAFTVADNLQGLRSFLGDHDEKALVRMVKKELAVSSKDRTRVMSLSLTAASSAFSAAAINALAEAYRRYVAEAFASSTQGMFLKLQEQAKQLAVEITDKANRLVAFKRRAEETIIRQTADAVATSADAESLALKNQLAQTDPAFAALQDELAQVEEDITRLADRYLEEHPNMQALRAKEDALKAKMERLKTRLLAKWMRSHREEQITVESEMLEQELDAARQQHALILTKMQEMDLSQDQSTANVRILKRAEPPAVPSSPRPVLNALSGLFAGLLGSLLMIFVRAQMRSQLITPDVEEQLRVPVIARIPRIAGEKAMRSLLDGDDPTSPESEVFRSLRTSIVAMGKPDSNVVLITSPDKGEGKSTISMALAQSCAKLGKQVLLIDTDLRRGHLYRRLSQVKPTKGLSEALVEGSDLSVQRISEHLSFIPSGKVSTSAAELLVSTAMEELIAEVSKDYHTVILDAPPLLPVTDAALLARYATLRLLVVRSGRTRMRSQKIAVDGLSALGYKLDGVIINDVARDDAAYYGYNYRYYRSETPSARKRG